jgi:hypothetical protein
VVLTFQDVHLLHQLIVVADEVLRYLLKMDYCQDVVDEELRRHQLKMDYYQDVVLQVLHLPHLCLPLKFSQLLPVLALIGAQHFLRARPSGLLGQRRVQPLIQQPTLDLPQRLFWQQFF